MSVEIPVRPDEFLLNLLEDDRDVPCNAPAHGTCAHAAQWAYRCEACKYDHQFCAGHRRGLDELIAMLWRGARCTPPGIECGADLPNPIPWRPL